MNGDGKIMKKFLKEKIIAQYSEEWKYILYNYFYYNYLYVGHIVSVFLSLCFYSRKNIISIFALTWGALWQNSSSVRAASVAPSTLKLSNGTSGNCNCRLAHCTQAATSAALQRLGSTIKSQKSDIILRAIVVGKNVILR